MANYVVLRVAERNMTVVGKADTQKEAQDILRNDFEEWFWQKYEAARDASFEEIYAKYAGDECELSETSAWLNDCKHTDFDWEMIDAVHDNILSDPMSMKQLVLSTSENDPYVKGYVLIEPNEMLETDLDGFLDLLSARLTGNICLMDVDYTPVDTTEDGRIVMQVSGDVSDILEISDEMIEELKAALLKAGSEALNDFIGKPISYYANNDGWVAGSVLEEMVDDAALQMPDEELVKFYRKYVHE